MAARLNHAEEEFAEVHEINVTPFIDVILVLLIIFMVAAPLSTVDVPVDLPVAAAVPQPRSEQPLFLTLAETLDLSLGNQPIARAEFAVAMDEATSGNKATRIFLRADEHVGYGEVMTIMNMLRDAGYLKIALVGLENAAVAPATTE